MNPRLSIACGLSGPLHVGKARVALAAYLYARRHNGHLVLRIDDEGPDPASLEPTDTIVQDLRWLGITWNETLRRSDRLYHYAAAAERLKRDGRLYPCFETEQELRIKRERRLKRGEAPIYDRAMLRLTPQQRAAAEANGKRPHWRLLLSGETISWSDLVLGAQRVDLASISDPVLIEAAGVPRPSFASVVDDIEGDITHIVRTQDEIAITAVQLDLVAALGASPAQWTLCHLPGLTGAPRRHRIGRGTGFSVRGLCRDGVEPIALATYLARLGVSDSAEPSHLDALAAEFDLAGISCEPICFDATQLLALNRQVLNALPFESVVGRLPSGATEAFWLAVRSRLDLLSEARGWWDVVAGTIVPPAIEGEQELLRTALDLLPPEPWDERVWAAWTSALRATTGRSAQSLFPPLRLALTGEDNGPDLRRLLPLIGRARVANRLQIAG